MQRLAWKKTLLRRILFNLVHAPASEKHWLNLSRACCLNKNKTENQQTTFCQKERRHDVQGDLKKMAY